MLRKSLVVRCDSFINTDVVFFLHSFCRCRRRSSASLVFVQTLSRSTLSAFSVLYTDRQPSTNRRYGIRQIGIRWWKIEMPNFNALSGIMLNMPVSKQIHTHTHTGEMKKKTVSSYLLMSINRSLPQILAQHQHSRVIILLCFVFRAKTRSFSSCKCELSIHDVQFIN